MKPPSKFYLVSRQLVIFEEKKAYSEQAMSNNLIKYYLII